MKKLTLIFALVLAVANLKAISPYFLVADIDGDLSSVGIMITSSLEAEGFRVIGEYNPENDNNKLVLVYTSPKLKSMCGTVADRGLLASALKIGIWNRDGKVRITMLNPEYLFFLYMRSEMDNKTLCDGLMGIDAKAKAAMMNIGGTMKPFGGDLDTDDLKKYKYMMGMPKFDDPVKLNEYTSFQEGVSTIKSNLEKGKSGSVKVFEIVDEKREMAVFGIGFPDDGKGEGRFLPIIGEKHIAGMPYEIILQGNKVTMLHGRFRFASHWPELTMGTFTKIMSSPGDVEDFMKSLTE